MCLGGRLARRRRRDDEGSRRFVFIGLWFIAAAVNLYVGVTRAGYSFMEELPIFLLIFGAPADRRAIASLEALTT